MCHGWVRDSMKEFKLERPSYHVLQSIVNVSAVKSAFRGKPDDFCN